MVRKIILTILFSAVVTQAHAGELRGGFGLYAGKTLFNFNNLNRHLTSYNYAKAVEDPLTLGFDSYIISGNGIVYGFEYGHYSGSSNAIGGGVEITGMRFSVYFGYVAYEKKGFRIMPEAGIGATNFDITITDISDEISFGEVMIAPSRSAVLGQNSYFSKINLAVDVDLIELNKNSYLTLGFRSGYHFATGSDRWNGGLVLVEKGPEVSLGGPYLNLVFYVSGVLRP